MGWYLEGSGYETGWEWEDYDPEFPVPMPFQHVESIPDSSMTLEKDKFYNSQTALQLKYSDEAVGDWPPYILTDYISNSPFVSEVPKLSTFFVSGWFKMIPDEGPYGTVGRVLIARWDESGTHDHNHGRLWKLIVDEHGAIGFYWTIDGLGDTINTNLFYAAGGTQVLDDNEWHHIIVKMQSSYKPPFNPAKVWIYVDGVIQSGGADGATIFGAALYRTGVGSTFPHIGRYDVTPQISVGCELISHFPGPGLHSEARGDSIFKGQIDDVALWVGASSHHIYFGGISIGQDDDAAVQEIYNKGIPIDLNYAKGAYKMNRNLAHWWTFEGNFAVGATKYHDATKVVDSAFYQDGLGTFLTTYNGQEDGSFTSARAPGYLPDYTTIDWESPPKEELGDWYQSTWSPMSLMLPDVPALEKEDWDLETVPDDDDRWILEE